MHAGAICVPVGARHVVVEKLDDFGAQVATVWDVDAATSWNQSMLRLPTHQMQQPEFNSLRISLAKGSSAWPSAIFFLEKVSAPSIFERTRCQCCFPGGEGQSNEEQRKGWEIK